MKRILKRAVDVTGALSALLVLLPVMGCIALGVRIFLGSPILFTQRRPGLHSQLFRMYKFRTMRDARDSSGRLLPDAQRVTRFGRLLRKSSLDELPELWNVLRGDMSLVGPRPLLPEYLPYYTERENLRHSVRPGLTGLAQVSGRNQLAWEERLELDAKYVESYTVWLDIRILVLTVFKVILPRDVALNVHAPLHVHRADSVERNCPSESPSRTNTHTAPTFQDGPLRK